VRNRRCVWLWLIIFGAVCSAAQRGTEKSRDGGEFAGTWTGTWQDDGSNSGEFDMMLQKVKGGGVGGRVSVRGDTPYEAVLEDVSFEGKNMTARYASPPDEGREMEIKGTFDGKAVSGTWSLRDKANGAEVARGTWNGRRK
jgi:hypothetical protein